MLVRCLSGLPVGQFDLRQPDLQWPDAPKACAEAAGNSNAWLHTVTKCAPSGRTAADGMDAGCRERTSARCGRNTVSFILPYSNFGHNPPFQGEKRGICSTCGSEIAAGCCFCRRPCQSAGAAEFLQPEQSPPAGPGGRENQLVCMQALIMRLRRFQCSAS